MGYLSLKKLGANLRDGTLVVERGQVKPAMLIKLGILAISIQASPWQTKPIPAHGHSGAP
jgi:hypothetical protein